MSWPASPPWLVELQQRFGELLRTPLDRETGELRALSAAYDPTLVAQTRARDGGPASERLAVYHRQYWFRLFTALQVAYPLTARLLGFWRFNELASQHLRQRPPRGFDLERIADGFDELVAETFRASSLVELGGGRSLDAGALVEAARVDAAFRRALLAPSASLFAPRGADVARLPKSRLLLAPSVSLVHERWPLCELRATLQDSRDERPLPLPPPLPTPQVRLLWRHGSELGVITLEAREAELLTLLTHHTVEHALALLEERTPSGELEALPERAQSWLERSVRLGVWCGFSEG